jgi:DNA-binding transcriptional ArsR family regulator
VTTTSALRATAHPLRLRILSLLTGAELSAAEVARELDTTQANASYHLRVLAGAGLLEPAGEVRIRGGVAKRYRHPWRVGKRSRSQPPTATERLDRLALIQVMAQEVVRRGAELSGGRTNFIDAELWVAPKTWQDCVELVDQAATLLHESARPPRTPGAVRVSMSAALFPMGDATSSAEPEAGAPEVLG